MKNTLIIDRDRYESVHPMISFSGDKSELMNRRGVNYAMIKMLDFYIVEEKDGSATFIKNRYNSKKHMTKEEYDDFKFSLVTNLKLGLFQQPNAMH